MPKYTTSSIGFPLSFEQPGSIEDYNALAGPRPSGLPAVLEDAVAGLVAWDTLPEWQAAFAKKLKETYPDFTQEVNEKATAAAKARAKTDEAKAKAVVYETIKTSVQRFLADKTDEEKAALAVLAQQVADGITVDPSPSRRQGTIKKDYIAKADSWLALDEDALEEKISKALGSVPSFNLAREDDGKPNRDSLARLIGAYIDVLAASV